MKLTQYKILLLACMLSLLALEMLLDLPGLDATGVSASTGLNGDSTPLKENGRVYEINPDEQGYLWISDLAGREIRRFDPSTDAYTKYPTGTAVSDARRDSRDLVWWSGFNSTFSSLSLVTNEVKTWETPGEGTLTATAVDGNGDVWLNDFVGQRVLRYSLEDEKLCIFSLPEEIGTSDYLLVSGYQLWFADRNHPQMVRLDVSQVTTVNLTTWPIAPDSYPEGLAVDDDGLLWWADEAHGELGRLDPIQSRIRSYPISEGMQPEMIAWGASQIYFSEHRKDMSSGRVGILAPETAAHTESDLEASEPITLTPDCQLITARTSAVTPVQGRASWSPGFYPLEEQVLGRSAYLIPGEDKNGNAYIPWGIAWSSGRVWVAVQGQQALLRLAGEAYAVHLPFAIR